ncbi:putative resolvase [Acetobacter malorum DSM 14337]|uniref:Resolvase n=1 Tax=Acetobacter malorum DSM 14337 TaxID=1307910 RepID=A0ABQ0PSZ5_9PROT|nr:recombinase family protein [Acetobacter malorum]KXV11990.1 resolvase [Acetobacter malorum]GBQ79598.1 putative resolvase [Acetobacter malorum DSM 14337]
MTKYGYARVSTLGQSLDEQTEQLIKLGIDKKNIYAEKITGVMKSDDRKEFSKLLNKLSSGDELVVMKLDRLGRSTIDILTTIQKLRSQGIDITIEGVGTIRSDMMGNLMTNLLASFAEFERSLIIDRTQSGRKRAIENGVKMGRKFKLSKLAMEAIKRRYPNETGKGLAKEYGVGLRTIQKIATGR